MIRPALFALVLAACASGPPPTSPADVEAHRAEQKACNDNATSYADGAACLAASHTRWAAAHPNEAP